jgi:ribosomal protein L7Ae-like RNA K-turn-binding protein
LQRVLETEVGPLTVERLREAIQEAVLQKIERLLGLARRARKVVVGSRAVWHALHTGRVGLLLASREISARGENRLCVEAKKRGTPVVGLFSGQELGAVLGGPPREVVGILNDGFANGIVQIVRYWIP